MYCVNSMECIEKTLYKLFMKIICVGILKLIPNADILQKIKLRRLILGMVYIFEYINSK